MGGGVLARRFTSLGGGGTSLAGLGGARTSLAHPLVSTPALPLVSTLLQNETETEKVVKRPREAEKEKERGRRKHK